MKGNGHKYRPEFESVALYAKALGHPARVAILNFLATRESCFFGDVHDVLPISKATVSKHLSELKDAGLIQGEILPPKVKYCINKEKWAEVQNLFSDFIDTMKESSSACCK